jgi:signal transduction histidine kinase
LAHASLNHSEGIGLGLYFVKKVADIHGGKVTLFSEPGFKTDITLTLPIK